MCLGETGLLPIKIEHFFVTVPDLRASQVVSFTLARTCTQASMHALARRATSQFDSPFKSYAEEVGID